MLFKINYQFKFQKRILIAAIFILSISLFNGCADDTTSPTGPTVTETFLTFTNACPNSPNVDIYVGGALAQLNIPFKGTMNYMNFIAGSNRIEVFANGTTTNPLIDTTVNLAQDQYYSIFAIDSLQSIKPLIVSDDLTLPGTTNCKARFLNLTPNGPSYDVQATGKTLPWFPDYSYGQYSSYRALPPGLFDINIVLQASSTVVLTTNDVNLQQGYIYTFFTSGFVGPLGTPPAPTFTVIQNFPVLTN